MGSAAGRSYAWPVTVLRSAIDDQSAGFAANKAAMLAKLAEIAAEHAKALAGGGPKYVERHRGRGKLLARERIELLLDPDTPFLELSPLAAWGTEFTVGAQRGHRHRRGRGRRVRDHGERPDGARRREQPVDAAEGAARQRDRARQPAAGDLAWWSRAARTCRARRRSSSPAARSSAT